MTEFPLRRQISRIVAALAAVALILLATGCASSTRRYERIGTAGAILVLSGIGVNLVAHSTIQPDNRPALIATGTVAGAAEVAGFVMMIYALDALISQGDPGRHPR